MIPFYSDEENEAQGNNWKGSGNFGEVTKVRETVKRRETPGTRLRL